MEDVFSVRNRGILITGSSRGLGFEMARGFAERGAKVLVNGTSKVRVERAVDELRASGGSAFGYPARPREA